jgi:beta-N-acetylglucosaminidase
MKSLKKSRSLANEKVLAMLKEVRNEQTKQSEDIQKAMNISYNKKIQKNNVQLLKQNGLSKYTDLGYCSDISVEDMNAIINYYEATAFQGHADAFIQAAEITGLNPIYIFAHAAVESGFGTSYLAQDRHNYFGIAAYDSNPDAALAMGNGVTSGIVAGAMWIKENYYDCGYITLEDMHNAGYATADDWANDISSIMNKAIQAM